MTTPTRNFLLFIVCSASILLSGCMGSNSSSTTACPQLRDTDLAPAHIAARQNPLPVTPENTGLGKDLYQSTVQSVACAQCHGKRGDGSGPMAKMFKPAPRNFTCQSTMNLIPDGQIYWIIKNGSVGTSMPAYNNLNEDQIWQLVMYVRGFAHTQ